MFRFRLIRIGVPAQTIQFEAGSHEELCEILSGVEQPLGSAGVLYVWDGRLPPGAHFRILGSAPIYSRPALPSWCEDVWPDILERGTDLDNQGQVLGKPMREADKP